MTAAPTLGKLCACGCGQPLPFGRWKWASKACQVHALQSKPRRPKQGNEPAGHWAWAVRVAKLEGLLIEIGPTETKALFAEVKRRFGWGPLYMVNVLASAHPVLVERGGEWRRG